MQCFHISAQSRGRENLLENTWNVFNDLADNGIVIEPDDVADDLRRSAEDHMSHRNLADPAVKHELGWLA